MPWHLSRLLLGIPLLGTACDQEVTCPAWSFAAVSVHATSATDASPLLQAVGEVQDGNYRDSLLAMGDGYYQAAPNRGGSYAVRIESQGFTTWDTAGVIVTEVGGACATVDTEHVEARLAPAE